MPSKEHITISIAIVDDSAPLRKLMGTYLSRQGFEIIHEAGTGEELLAALYDAGRVPDLCLLDTNMPGMSGRETARQLHADYPSVRIMAYSFDDDADTVREMLGNGAHNYISKDESASSVSSALKALHLSR